MGSKKALMMVSILFLCMGLCLTVHAAKKSKKTKKTPKKAIEKVEKVDKGAVRIKKFTGTIRIVTPSKVITISKGDKIPKIPFGSKIHVIKGKAEIVTGDTRIFLRSKQMILIDKNRKTGAIELVGVDKSKGSIKVQAGSSKVKIKMGEKVSITENDEGKPEIKVIKGTVEVVAPGEEKKLQPGDIATEAKEERIDNIIPEPPMIELEEASPSIP